MSSVYFDNHVALRFIIRLWLKSAGNALAQHIHCGAIALNAIVRVQ